MRVAAALFFSMQVFAPEAMAAPKVVAAPAPPQPMEQKVTVKRGGSVEIPLKIYGTRAQTLAWVIRRPPAHGKLSAVKATGAESAVVIYRPPADVRLGSDRFTFSVRSSEGVSASVEVTIAITDEPPQISTAGELNFGTLLAGASAARTFEFSNSGGGIAEGTMAVDAPWKLEGARDYKLAAGERRVVTILFAPERVGTFESEVKFTSQPDAAVVLRGVVEDALAVAPTELLLAQDAGRPLRAASFEIRNHTDAAMEVAIEASPRLILKTPVNVGAHGTATVTVQTGEKDVAALEETVSLSAGGLRAHLSVKAKALPALVRAQTEGLVFRKGANTKERLIFENCGGMESKVTLAIDAPFSVEERAFSLAPGAEKEVVVSLGAGVSGGVQAVLKVGVEGGGFEIPVEATGPGLPVLMPAARRPQATGAAKGRREAGASGPVTVHSGPFAATVDSISENSATFRWQGAPAGGAEFRCLLRVLTTNAEGELVSEFRDYPAWRIAREEEANVATVENLEPGKAYLFRIDEVSATGTSAVTFAQIRAPSPPPRASTFSPVKVLSALAIVAGAFAIWQRQRSRGGF